MLIARLLFAALFTCGCFFATFVWVFIPLSLGIFQPQSQFGIRDIIVSIAGCGLAISGYFVWANWLLFAVRGRFFPGRGLGVQIVSFFNHLGWLAFLPFMRNTNIFEVVYALPLEVMWLLTNMAIALLASLMLISDPGNDELSYQAS